MPEATIEPGGYVSLRLVARAAGIPLNAVRQIAGEAASGRRPTWLGAALRVRTRVENGSRHRDIALDSLPDVLRAELAGPLRFQLAAEHAEPDAELRHFDFLLLDRAARSGIDGGTFDHLVTFLCDGGPLTRASRVRFDLVMDRLFGFGFRDPMLFEVGADYLAFLDACRRGLGIGDAAVAALLTEAGAVHAGKAMPVLLTGARFVELLDGIHAARGRPVPPLPERRFMTRAVMGQIRAAVRGLGLSYAEHRAVLVTIGGGVRRTRDLDERGAQRVMWHYVFRGYALP